MKSLKKVEDPIEAEDPIGVEDLIKAVEVGE